MNYAGVSGAIVVCGRESRLHEAEMLHGEGDQPVCVVDFKKRKNFFLRFEPG